MKSTILITLLLIVSFTSLFSQIPEKPEAISPLSVGDRIPELTIKNINNESVLLTELVKEQKTILLFYRGGWCPYCNKQLSAIGESLEEINTLGYQIVGISPDSSEELKKSIAKNNINYTLLSDSNSELSTAMGIAFKAPEKYSSMLLNYSDDLNSGILPVPSIFILNTAGVILYEYVNADYKERISQEELINALKELN